MRTTSAGSKQRMSSSLIGDIRDKAGGRSTEWHCQTKFWKRCSTKTQRRFSRCIAGRIAMPGKSLSGIGTTYLLALLAFGASAGCEKEATRQTAPQISSVTVEKQGDGIHVKTNQAEFVFTPNGNLLARRRDGAATTTI